MALRAEFRLALLSGGLAVAALAPALAQQAPESILPPGFGDPPPARPAEQSTRPQPTAPGDTPPATTPTQAPAEASDPPPLASTPASTSAPAAPRTDEDAEGATDEAGQPLPIDLPPQARRTLDHVGLIGTAQGGLAKDAFGRRDGGYLRALMDGLDAPVASRWMHIALRRALLSDVDSPPNIGGADWVASRVWLLVRMGEADAARALLARVDSDRATPWLAEAGLQAALASADPAAACGLNSAAEGRAWTMVRAMCAGLSGEAGTASALIEEGRRQGKVRGLDALLPEKVAAVGSNTRRSITIQWDGIERLTAWRYGLAAATGVAIPDSLYATVGPQVQAWRARAPLYPLTTRLPAMEAAAVLGVFSADALVDGYAASDALGEGRDDTSAQLRDAFAAEPGARLNAIRTLWGRDTGYGRLLLTARAAASVDVSQETGQADSDRLIAAMLSAGYDLQAQRWRGSVAKGSPAWGLLAVGAPQGVAIAAGDISDFGSATSNRRGAMLAAAALALGRIDAGDAQEVAQDHGVRTGPRGAWSRAIAAAADRGEAGTVVLLAAAGFQGRWSDVDPTVLFHALRALRQVGLEPEARMIAAEALTRA